MSFAFINAWRTAPSMESIIADVEKSERATYDYPALAKEFEDKCPADYPWMKQDECRKLGTLWAWQAGAMTEAPEIAFDNAMFATCDRAKKEGRLAPDASGFETYYENHPVVNASQCTRTSSH